MRKFLIFAMLAMLIVSPALASKPSTPIIGEMYGNDLHGTSVSPVQWGVMEGNLSGATQFACPYFAGRGDDAYNQGWKVYLLTGGTNTTAGTVVDITDYVSATGTFTTVSAGANYDNGDPFLLVFEGLGQQGNPVTITNYDQPLPGSDHVDTLFIFQGPWLINEVVGHVTTVIGTGANNAKLSIVNAGTTTDICANLDIDADAKNSWYLITGTFVDAMVNSAAKVPLAGAQAGGIRLAPGDNYLIITTSATKAGEISWSVNATPLSSDATAFAFTVE